MIPKSAWIMRKVYKELFSAQMNWPPMNSPHEGYAILLEEVDELWDLVKVNAKKHDHAAMEREAIQVAAMALRFIIDCCGEKEYVDEL